MCLYIIIIIIITIMHWVLSIYPLLSIISSSFYANHTTWSYGACFKVLVLTVSLFYSYYMVDLSWLSSIMYTIKFKLSVQCQFSSTLYLRTKISLCQFSLDHFGDVLVNEDGFHIPLIVFLSQPQFWWKIPVWNSET